MLDFFAFFWYIVQPHHDTVMWTRVWGTEVHVRGVRCKGTSLVVADMLADRRIGKHIPTPYLCTSTNQLMGCQRQGRLSINFSLQVNADDGCVKFLTKERAHEQILTTKITSLYCIGFLHQQQVKLQLYQDTACHAMSCSAMEHANGIGMSCAGLVKVSTTAHIVAVMPDALCMYYPPSS